jgi:hypothetical protein
MQDLFLQENRSSWVPEGFNGQTYQERQSQDGQNDGYPHKKGYS